MATNEFNVANTSLQINQTFLGFGIADFADQLQFAENDVLRRIRRMVGKIPAISHSRTSQK